MLALRSTLSRRGGLTKHLNAKSQLGTNAFRGFASQLADGEYLDEGKSFTLVEPLGKVTKHRQFTDSRGSLVDEIMQVELTQETVFTQQTELANKLDKFTADIGIKFDSVEDKKAESQAAHLSPENENLSKLTQILSGIKLDAPSEQTGQVQKRQTERISANEHESRLAYVKLDKLKEILSEKAQAITQLTLDDLRKSPSLRSMILDYDVRFFLTDPEPRGSFKRVFDNEKQAQVAEMQSIRQSSIMKSMNENAEAKAHNQRMLQEFRQEEEGLAPPPEKRDMKLFRKQVMQELDELATRDKETSEVLKQQIFDTDTELHRALTVEIPDEEVQWYPGSIKGPEPEDDPEEWSRWYYEHQPKSAFPDGKILPADLGVRFKYLKPKAEMQTSGYGSENRITQMHMREFMDKDQLFETWNNYDIRPEFALLSKSNFVLQEGVENPQFAFSSNMGPHELPVTQPDLPRMYQNIHYGLEKWTTFRLLPQILAFDKRINDWSRNVQIGMDICPEYHKEKNQPSLWTYYETLPQWCRDQSIVRATLFAFEYHKPHLDIRQKEQGLNFVASMMRPIEGRFRDVLTEVAVSNKIRITMENGKDMMNELNFYTIDVADLGSDTEDDGDDDAAQKEFNRLLMGGGIDEEEAAARGNMLEKVMKQIGETDLEKERSKVYEEELTTNQYELDPEVEKCMVDFPVKGYAKIDDIQAAEDIANEHIYPINFYDNEDGFWDEYIKEKQDIAVEAGFLTNRRWFKH